VEVWFWGRGEGENGGKIFRYVGASFVIKEKSEMGLGLHAGHRQVGSNLGIAKERQWGECYEVRENDQAGVRVTARSWKLILGGLSE